MEGDSLRNAIIIIAILLILGLAFSAIPIFPMTTAPMPSLLVGTLPKIIPEHFEPRTLQFNIQRLWSALCESCVHADVCVWLCDSHDAGCYLIFILLDLGFIMFYSYGRTHISMHIRQNIRTSGGLQFFTSDGGHNLHQRIFPDKNITSQPWQN